MWSKIYMKKTKPSDNDSISNRFMQGSVYFSPLFSSHYKTISMMPKSITTADVAYSPSDLFAATVHYTESTYVSNVIVLAVHELNLIYCMFQVVLHSFRSLPQYCLQY